MVELGLGVVYSEWELVLLIMLLLLNDGTCLKLNWFIGDAEERNTGCTEQHLVICVFQAV